MQANDPQVKHLNDYLDSLSPEQRNEIVNRDNERTKRLFQAIKEGLPKGQCGICGHQITHFAKTKPCHHWLLNPTGIRKKYFSLLFERWSFHEIEAYLRWVANIELMGVNINDLESERSPSKLIEQTIRYKEIEWSFSCGKNDMQGHADKFEGKNPHYHFQMKINGNTIIKFNDLHIDFHPRDFYCFAVKDGLFPRLGYQHVNAASAQTFLDNLDPEILLDHLSAAHDDEKRAMFKLDTFIKADEGTKLPMDIIGEIIEEKKRTGVSLAKLLRDRKIKNVSVTTIISPGSGIPNISKRNPR